MNATSAPGARDGRQDRHTLVGVILPVYSYGGTLVYLYSLRYRYSYNCWYDHAGEVLVL
jgi:hypothetical protein